MNAFCGGEQISLPLDAKEAYLFLSIWEMEGIGNTETKNYFTLFLLVS